MPERDRWDVEARGTESELGLLARWKTFWKENCRREVWVGRVVLPLDFGGERWRVWEGFVVFFSLMRLAGRP